MTEHWMMILGFFCMGAGLAAQISARRMIKDSTRSLQEATETYRKTRMMLQASADTDEELPE